MERKLISIGELAELCRVTARTLRHYQKVGLLQPVHVDECSGYRYYSASQTRDMQTIGLLQTLGLSLDEISSLIASGTSAEALLKVQNCLDDIEQRQRDLDLARHLGSKLLNAYRVASEGVLFDRVLLEHRPAQHILVFPVSEMDIPPKLACADQWTRMEAHLKRALEKDSLSSLCYNIGGIIAQDNGSSPRPDYDRLFVYCDGGLGVDSPATEIIPGGFFLTIYREHYQASEEFIQNEVEQLALLRSEAEARGLRICGDYYCESIVTAPLLGYTGYDGLSQLSVPVEEAN